MEETEILTQPPAVWVQIDLNARSRDGYVRARSTRASGPVVAGDQHVIVYEPDDHVAAPARVVRVDTERGFVYLDVAWAQMDDDVAYGWVASPRVVNSSEMESNAAAEVSMRVGFVEKLKASWLLPVSQHVGNSGIQRLPIRALAVS